MTHTRRQPQRILTAASAGDDRGALNRAFDWGLTVRLARRMGRHPRLFRLVMVLAGCIATLNVTIMVVLNETIRVLIQDESAIGGGWFGLPTRTCWWLGVSLMVLLAGAWYGVMRWRQYAVNDLAERVVCELRRDIFAHLQLLGIDFYDRTKVGRILARGTGDVMAIRGAVGMVAPRIVIAVIQMAYALGIMLYYDLVLGGVVVVVAPLMYAVNWRFRQKLSNAYRAVQESYSLITANIAESIAGMRVTQAFVRQETNLEMFAGLCDQHRQRHLKAARYQGIYVPFVDVASQIFIALALVLGGYRVHEGVMSVGDLLGFMLMTGVFFQPVAVIGDMYNVILQAMAGAERVFRLLDTRPAALDPPTDQVQELPRTGSGMRVEFRNVTFGYEADRPVLRDISFVAEPGRTIALVGPTGSGKTSIVSLIARFYDYQQGLITLDGQDIRRITQANLHAQMGIVLQENVLFAGSVADNIRFAQPDASDEEVVAVCDRLGCLDVLQRLPDGLQTNVGERGARLSAGQRQLTCFARSMLANPRLLILDEATSAVDTVTEARIQASLNRLLAGRTSFIVAHRLSTIRHADLVLVVDAGRLVEQGTHDQLMAMNGEYRQLHDEFVRMSRGDRSLI